MQLRPYQIEAFQAVLSEWERVHRTLLVLPTGCGKTIVFAKIAENQVRNSERVLILAHRGELLEQASDKIQKACNLNCAVEKAESSCLGLPHRIVVGSVQSLMHPKRLEKFQPNYFDTIIIDEAHHVISDSYQRVLSHFPEAHVLGVTATPDRGDMKNLGSFFDTLAYEYTLPKAIHEGYLCPIKAETIPLKIDFSKVKVQAGDFKNSDIDTALAPYLEQIAVEMKKRCMNRKTVIFLPLIKTSQKFCELLNQQGFHCAEVNGNSPDRAEILADFENGKYNALCNSMLLTEGWDCPSVDCVVVLRPTKVRSLYCQMVGRGTRLCDGKKELLLLDFLWNTERHELCRPACLIAKDKKISDKMTELINQAENPISLEDAEKQASEETVQNREQSLADKLEACKHRKGKLVDPLQYEISIHAEELVNYVPSFGWESKPVSPKQASTLEHFGINPALVECAGKAKEILIHVRKRIDAGLSTPKQIKLLERYGFQRVGDWTFQEASNMIARISAQGWRCVPSGVNPETYKPSGE
ncbi:MAG: DEAD/DEAH box helicase [Oscillospiraceae bacterium]|nr:DEAD/DEAH box helicase [Oscillospiraceae bacterium]